MIKDATSSGILTMLGWSRPFNTSISPHTLASFPFTFFFGIIFSATSFATTTLFDELRDGVEAPDDGLEGDFPGPKDKFRLGFGGACEIFDSSSDTAAAPCSATVICSGGTCHVAR